MEIPYDRLQADTLRRLVEEFVTRDGTDNGEANYSLDDRVAAVMRQLKRGEAAVDFDPETQSCNVVRVEKSRR
jgi:hypothetical protein